MVLPANESSSAVSAAPPSVTITEVEESEESSQETFQSKLTRLVKLVASCHILLPDKDTCQTVIEIATEDNIDVLISGLDNEKKISII